MSKFPNLKLYRKFLILAVLLAGLFISSSSANRAGATLCCDYCQILYVSCMNTCANGLPENYESCIVYICEENYIYCGGFCQDDIGAWGCNHP